MQKVIYIAEQWMPDLPAENNSPFVLNRCYFMERVNNLYRVYYNNDKYIPYTEQSFNIEFKRI